jgi:hypothetical protein
LRDLRRRRDTLFDYVKTGEFKNNLARNNEWELSKDAKFCNDVDVRQVLTKKNRTNTAAKNNVDEKDIPLDFPVQNVRDYVRDLTVIIDRCEI